MSDATRTYLAARLRLLPWMLGVGVASGLAVKAIVDLEGLRLWWEGDRLHGPEVSGVIHSIVSGMVYTTAMWSVLLETKRFLLARYPISTWRDGALHVVAIATAATATFVLIGILDPVVCAIFGLEDDGDGPPLAVIAGVAFSMTLVLSTLMYLVEFYRRLRDAEHARLQAELSALRAQINPHFLFNTLNSIAALVRVAPSEAEGVTERLADLFRYTLRASKHPTVTLRDELDATQLYIDIEQVRFQDRLLVHVKVDPAVERAQVPSLLVQPLVENAVKHGVARTDGPCVVRIRAHIAEHVAPGRAPGPTVELQVFDTGPGFDSRDVDTVLQRGSGLANVRDRLRLLYGDAASLHLMADGVVLRFPFRAMEIERTGLMGDGLPGDGLPGNGLLGDGVATDELPHEVTVVPSQ
ncbi:MAG: histidine kinase, partial [Bacteroidota bacterium]